MKFPTKRRKAIVHVYIHVFTIYTGMNTHIYVYTSV